MKEIKIEIPDGYEVDKDKSTFERIVLKKKNSLFADFCIKANTTEDDFNERFKNLDKNTIAFEKLKLFSLVLNEGWTPNWKDYSEYKYTFYCDRANNKPSLVFNFYDCDSSASARLCFKNEKDVKFIIANFSDILNDYFNG